jgi:hypothetical protein
MWMYPGSSCPDRSFSADVEIDTWIRRTLALRPIEILALS